MFVVFEGIDGSGKTTVSNRVVDRLRALGLAVKHLRAEGKFASSVTEAIRALGRDVKNLDLVPQAEFLLYVARDVQLIEEALRPALLEHDVVIADRFLYTAEVLACYGRRLSPEWAAPVLRAAANQLLPDSKPERTGFRKTTKWPVQQRTRWAGSVTIEPGEPGKRPARQRRCQRSHPSTG
jgi:dTMP kinase